MPGDEGNPVPPMDLDRAFDAADAVSSLVVRAVSSAVDLFGVLEGGVEKRIPASQVEPPDAAADVDLEPLPECLSEVLEIPEAGLFRRDEEDVVAVVRAEPRGIPPH